MKTVIAAAAAITIALLSIGGTCRQLNTYNCTSDAHEKEQVRDRSAFGAEAYLQNREGDDAVWECVDSAGALISRE